MRRHVVDASVVIKWFVEEVQADHARELQDDQYELFAPDLLWPESGNILWKKVQRGELMADEARLICAGLLKQPIQIFPNLRYPQVSPDGKLLAYAFDDEQTKRPKIAVIEFEGGAPFKTFDLPVTTGTSFYESSFYHGFHWSPDGHALTYINTLAGVSNLWRQPLDGGAPKQITNFKTDQIYNFAYSRDGRELALARGSRTRDAVLISELK